MSALLSVVPGIQYEGVRTKSDALASERVDIGADIVRAFRGQIHISDQLDVICGRLWDSIEYLKGSTIDAKNASLFWNCGNSSGKGPADTNMVNDAMLAAPDAFSVRRIVFSFSRNTSESDVAAFSESAVFEFRLGRKVYASDVLMAMRTAPDQRAPLRICDFCAGVYVGGQCPGCGSRAFSLMDFGDGGHRFGRQFFMEFSVPHVIANQMSFHVGWALWRPHTVIGERFKLWCHLEGLHAQSVRADGVRPKDGFE